ncbi:MAG: hypothetical protein LJE92_18230 [Gammaproteobacteria bacterium]|jgi:hypothetical protein|nr:hypothetical protein [Gammaproteobacteria bacterium]
MQYQALKQQHKLRLIDDFWSPGVIAEKYDYPFKPVRAASELACLADRVGRSVELI